MAELIFTEAEKAAPLWSDLDDATLGKLVKKQISVLTSASAQLDRTALFSAALLLCCSTAEADATSAKFELEGVTDAGRELGNWTVVTTRTTPAEPAPAESVTDLLRGLDASQAKRLLELTEAQLVALWNWAYDPEKSPDWNLYDFSRHLEPYRLRCRQWEMHHNGDCCVVERVRAKYVMPHIKTFLAAVERHANQP